MRSIFVAAVFLLCALGVIHAKSYDNRNYGIHVELPDGKAVCLTPPPGPDHGLVILLNSSDCSHLLDAARMEVFVHSNVPSEIETTSDLTRGTCRDARGRPTDTRLNGLRLNICEFIMFGGLSLETYFAPRPLPGREVTRWTVFEISLYCQTNDRPRYTNSLRRLLAGMRLIRPW
jgi:hypothetical protein